jgi:hypothetical protein
MPQREFSGLAPSGSRLQTKSDARGMRPLDALDNDVAQHSRSPLKSYWGRPARSGVNGVLRAMTKLSLLAEIDERLLLPVANLFMRTPREPIRSPSHSSRTAPKRPSRQSDARRLRLIRKHSGDFAARRPLFPQKCVLRTSKLAIFDGLH